ncbi:hypothetical protein GCM10010121_077920 [Streptomyces brasiliensis]|uniref:Uncharacterized protein n=1 Tax=Streptomyces brasiliensis TaxID=1954 RepID=A0A917LCA2_9ACTN|nr:hypothetical protein GCM10010121_077920 [Streptomyces brasiliensis]
MEQMGGVDLPVPVPDGPPAGTSHHRCQLGTEPGIVVRGTQVLLIGGLMGNTGLHISTPSAPPARVIPGRNHLPVPHEVDVVRRNLLLRDEIRPNFPEERVPPCPASQM